MKYIKEQIFQTLMPDFQSQEGRKKLAILTDDEKNIIKNLLLTALRYKKEQRFFASKNMVYLIAQQTCSLGSLLNLIEEKPLVAIIENAIVQSQCIVQNTKNLLNK
jgi:hypothetical protein